MKKYVALFIAISVLSNITACSQQTNSAITKETTITSEQKSNKVSDEALMYGTKALDAIDKYLDNEIEIEEAYETINSIDNLFEYNENQNQIDAEIKTYISLFSTKLSPLTELNIDFNSLLAQRNSLAERVGKPVKELNIENNTKSIGFNITGNDFIKKMNTGLEVSNTGLKLENFQKTVSEDSNIFITETNNIQIMYTEDKNTNILTTFYISTKIDEATENTFSDLGKYLGTVYIILDNNDTADTFNTDLKLDNFSTEGTFVHESETVAYVKTIENNTFSLLIQPKK